ISMLNERKYNQEAPKLMQFKLIDKNRKVIYTTEPIPRFTSISPRVASQLFEGQTKNSGYFIAQGRAPEKGKELFAYARSNGYKDYKGLGWILLIEHETKEIFSPAIRLRNSLIILLFGGTIFNIIIGLFVSHAISNPAEKLANAARDVGEGKLDTYVQIGSHDEFGLLAVSFNEMAENLRKSTTSIENLNKEISERKKVEEHLRNTYEELKKIQDQLIQAEKINAMGLLAGGVAHEVKNPLAVIIQGADYLLKTVPPGETEILKTLHIIKRNVKRADNIVRGLLDFSKTTNLNLSLIDINSILEKSWGLLKPQVITGNIKVIKEMKNNLPKIMADKAKMEQVAINILLNAIQALPKGGEIFIRSYDTKIESAQEIIQGENNFFEVGEKIVVVEIEDTGVGISEENMKNVFDPFFTTKGPREGAGLGLSVSKSILAMHKGAIGVESSLGKGTKITIVLKPASH
ncbi:MAG: ATP-binding protein, partial [Candidatus Omnitrophica bacterium]|nr:ATP-binding protein [Candidatus Omnitrophota bacterium]